MVHILLLLQDLLCLVAQRYDIALWDDTALAEGLDLTLQVERHLACLLPPQ